MKLMSQSWVNRNLILFTLVFWTSSAFSQSLFNIYAKRDIKKFEQHIKKKPDLANSQENGNFIIHLVTRNNSLPFLKILVDNGSNINQQDIQGYTPLYYAVINGNREISLYLLENDADVNSRDADKNSLLVVAVQNNDLDICKLLVKYGIDLDSYNSDGLDAFSIACLNGKTTIAEYLMSQMKMIHPVDVAGCIAANDTVLLRQALFKGGNINDTLNGRLNMLHIAAISENPGMIEYLLNQGFKPDISDQYGATPLLYASEYNDNTEVMIKLLDAGADVNYRDHEGFNALIYSIDYDGDRGFDGIKEKIRLLLSKGADINLSDNNGNRALMYASGKGLRSIVALLIEMGADPNLKNQAGETAAHFAKSQGSMRTNRLIKKIQKKWD